MQQHVLEYIIDQQQTVQGFHNIICGKLF